MKKLVTQGRLKEVLSYNKDTGVFTWLVSTSNRVKAGDVAGCMDEDYYTIIGVDGRTYLAHKLAWLYIYGYHTENQLDHIDQDKTNNRINNLREVSHSCNVRNTGNRKNNTSGVKGITRNKRDSKWTGVISISGKGIFLGSCEDFTEAVCHRLAAEQAENWEGCSSSSPAYLYVQKYLRGKNYDYLCR